MRPNSYNRQRERIVAQQAMVNKHYAYVQDKKYPGCDPLKIETRARMIAKELRI